MTTLKVNGHTYTDDDSPATGMGNGGHRARLLPMLSDTMRDISTAVTGTTASAASAAASAATAIVGAATSASSTNTLTISLASKTLTVQPGKNFAAGMFVTLARTSAPSTAWMNGPVTAYNQSTGALTVNVTRAQGAGSGADWTVTLSAPASPATGGTAINTWPTAFIGATALKYQVMPTAGYGGVWSLSGATNAIQGPSTFTLRNDAGNFYPYDMRVDIDDIPVGFVRANKNASIDVVDAVYRARDTVSYGAPVIAQVNFTSLVAGTAGLWTKAVRLASGHTLLLIHGAHLHAVCAYADGSFSAPILVRSGLATAGSEGNVAAVAVNDGTDNVLVMSVPDGGTALQSVVVVLGGEGLSLGTVATTTVSATLRIVEVRPVVDAAGGLLFIAGLMNAAGNSLMTYGLTMPGAGATTVSLGVLRSDTTVGGMCALLTDPALPNVFMTVTSTSTTLNMRAVNLSAAGAQTAGLTVTATVTASSPFLVRAQTADRVTESGYWSICYIASNVVKVAKLTLTGNVPAISAAVTVNSAITVVGSIALGDMYNSSVQSVAVCGTDAGSRALVEISEVNMQDAVPQTPVMSPLISMASAATAVWIGRGAYGGPTAARGLWQVTSGTELVIANTLGEPGVPTIQRLLNAPAHAAMLLPPDTWAVKSSRNRNTLRSDSRVLALGDGSKPSMEYFLDVGCGEPTARPVPTVNGHAMGSFSGDLYCNSVWMAAGAAPATSLLLQNFVIY